MKLSQKGMRVITTLQRSIKQLEVLLAEQKADGVPKEEIAQTQESLKQARSTYTSLQQSIQELKKCQM